MKRAPWLIAFALACGDNAESRPPPAAQAPAEAPAQAPAEAPPVAKAELKVGDAAPDFSASDQEGKPVALAALRGKHVVLYFYPKDETPGCTAEAQAFRDSYEGLRAKGAEIIGVSADSDESHRAFAKNHQLPFRLVSDADGTLAGKYNVPVNKGYTARQSFVIGPDGTLKAVYRQVDVSSHAAQITALIP